ncbi:hypothetical protein LCGC14_0850640 [marine sediment metagenome]|uniref:Uncharacterized protein n=1 Tax=marine sediment metagenome TaxID=412755 RepID=A0A0F9RVA5_9ZZZZ
MTKPRRHEIKTRWTEVFGNAIQASWPHAASQVIRMVVRPFVRAVGRPVRDHGIVGIKRELG